MIDSNYFKKSFSLLKKPIPKTFEYAGTKHTDLIRNIKEDVAQMVKIENKKDFNYLKEKSIYKSCINRLERILKQLLLIDNI